MQAVKTIFDVLDEDLKQGEIRRWHRVDEDTALDMLGAVPPIRGGYNAFLAGEPKTHTTNGRGVYFACLLCGGEYWAMYATVEEWTKRQLVVGRTMPKLDLWGY